MTDYTCPGLGMQQPTDAPREGYVACYRAGHACPSAVAVVADDDYGRHTVFRCPCCGQQGPSFYVPHPWSRWTT